MSSARPPLHPPATGGMKTIWAPSVSDVVQGANSLLTATRRRSEGSVKP